jgi:hypothetical protein
MSNITYLSIYVDSTMNLNQSEQKEKKDETTVDLSQGDQKSDTGIPSS